MSPAERQRLRAIPARIPGEAVSEQGIPALESDFQLSRSPGCFVVTLSSDGSEVYIGEDWVGLGTSEDEGGLEGCSEDRPGLVFLADGQMFPVGGKTTKSASSIYTEAGAAGTTLLLALIPDPDSGLTGIVYRAIHVSGTISGNLGVWDDARDYLPPVTYDEYHIVPIAMLDLTYSGGIAKVRDVYWNLDKPVVTIGNVSSIEHPWKISVDGSNFSVLGGYVNIGAWLYPAFSGMVSVAGIGPIALGAVNTYVWLTVTHPNTGAPYSTCTLLSGTVLPKSSYVFDAIPSDGTAPPFPLVGYCTMILPVGIITSSGQIYQHLLEDQFVPWGSTTSWSMTVGYRDTGSAIQAVVAGCSQICGVQAGPGSISYVTLVPYSLNCP